MEETLPATTTIYQDHREHVGWEKARLHEMQPGNFRRTLEFSMNLVAGTTLLKTFISIAETIALYNA